MSTRAITSSPPLGSAAKAKMIRQSYSTQQAQSPASCPRSLWVLSAGSKGSAASAASASRMRSGRVGSWRASRLNARLKLASQTSFLIRRPVGRDADHRSCHNLLDPHETLEAYLWHWRRFRCAVAQSGVAARFLSQLPGRPATVGRWRPEHAQKVYSRLLPSSYRLSSYATIAYIAVILLIPVKHR